jgi:hypothetical protein
LEESNRRLFVLDESNDVIQGWTLFRNTKEKKNQHFFRVYFFFGGGELSRRYFSPYKAGGASSVQIKNKIKTLGFSSRFARKEENGLRDPHLPNNITTGLVLH